MNLATRRPAIRAAGSVHPANNGSSQASVLATDTQAALPDLVPAANLSPSAVLDEFAGDPNFMTSLARGRHEIGQGGLRVGGQYGGL
jgi:hypothetical protein